MMFHMLPKETIGVLEKTPVISDTFFLNQVPPEIRADTQKLLTALHDKNPTAQQKQMLVDIVNAMVKRYPIPERRGFGKTALPGNLILVLDTTKEMIHQKGFDPGFLKGILIAVEGPEPQKVLMTLQEKVPADPALDAAPSAALFEETARRIPAALQEIERIGRYAFKDEGTIFRTLRPDEQLEKRETMHSFLFDAEEVLQRLISNPTFQPSMLGKEWKTLVGEMEQIIQEKGTDAKSYLNQVKAWARFAPLSSATGTGLAKALFAINDYRERKTGYDAKTGYDDEPDILFEFLLNGKIAPQNIENAAKELAETIRFLRTNAGEFEKEVMEKFGEVTRNKTFRVEMLPKFREPYIKAARRIADELGLFGEGREKTDVLLDVLDNVFGDLTVTMKMIEGIDEKYEEGKMLAAELGIENADAETHINLAYGLAAIGKGKTAALHRRFGMEYFMRYTPATLETLYENIDPKKNRGKPPLFVVFNKNDWNGSFYSAGQQLDALHKFYRVTVMETDNETGVYTGIEGASRAYGNADTWIIGGHGTTDSIRMGSGGEAQMLDLSDEDELKKLQEYSPKKIILVACSTGEHKKAVGAMISRTFRKARLFAPDKPAAVKKFVQDERGEIQDVEYTKKSGVVFHGGLLAAKNR